MYNDYVNFLISTSNCSIATVQEEKSNSKKWMPSYNLKKKNVSQMNVWMYVNACRTCAPLALCMDSEHLNTAVALSIGVAIGGIAST